MKFIAIYPFILYFFLLCSPAYSQQLAPNGNIVNLGLGFGSGYHIDDGFKGFPAITLSYERILPEKIGPGLAGVGMMLAYRGMKSEDTWIGGFTDYDVNGVNNYEARSKMMVIAARGTYYWEKLVTAKYNVYGAILAGVRIEQVRAHADLSVPGSTVRIHFNDVNEVHPHLGLVAGGRYYFTPDISVFAELGYDVAWAKAGISARF